MYDGVSTVYERTGLTAGTSYSHTVSAVSLAGEGVQSTALDQFTAPGAAVTITFSEMKTDSMVLAWSAPSGAAPTSYRVYRDNGAGATPSIAVYAGADATATIDGLTGGTAYSYTVESLSDDGVGDVSAVATQSTSPAAPLDFSSTAHTSTSISLSWSAPVSDGGEAVAGYTVYVDDGSGGAIDSVVSCGGDALSTTCEATGLTGGTEYKFQVLATSAARESDRSAALAQSTSPAAVGAITFSDMKMESMVLTWSAPAGGAPTGYIVYRLSLIHI